MPRRSLCKTRTRIDLLFTMSENPPGCALRKAGEYKLRTKNHRRCPYDNNEVQAKRSGRSTIWWSQTGSNRRPHACKARALPAELWPRNQKTNAALDKMVGLGRLELPTSRLSSARSNQLSYKPSAREAAGGTQHRHNRSTIMPTSRMRAPPQARVRPRRKRNEDGEVPPMRLV